MTASTQQWNSVYHTLFWLDLYLTGAEEGFAPPPPFALIEMAEDDLPDRAYTKDELQIYLDDCRRKCQATIEALTGETAQRLCQFSWSEVSFVELQRGKRSLHQQPQTKDGVAAWPFES